MDAHILPQMISYLFLTNVKTGVTSLPMIKVSVLDTLFQNLIRVFKYPWCFKDSPDSIYGVD